MSPHTIEVLSNIGFVLGALLLFALIVWAGERRNKNH
jgi:hypothetical protein